MRSLVQRQARNVSGTGKRGSARRRWPLTCSPTLTRTIPNLPRTLNMRNQLQEVSTGGCTAMRRRTAGSVMICRLTRRRRRIISSVPGIPGTKAGALGFISMGKNCRMCQLTRKQVQTCSTQTRLRFLTSTGVSRNIRRILRERLYWMKLERKFLLSM